MFAPLLLARRGSVLKEHIMEGMLTHVARADCFITPPHRALDCGIVTAWWHFRVMGDTATAEDEQRQRQRQG